MDLTILWIISAVVIHWIADFVLQQGDLQTDAKSIYISKRCQSYASSFSIMSTMLWLAIGQNPQNTIDDFAAYLLVCVISHSLVDFALIPVLYKYKANIQKLGLFWAFDQVIHISFIITSLYYFLL